MDKRGGLDCVCVCVCVCVCGGGGGGGGGGGRGGEGGGITLALVGIRKALIGRIYTSFYVVPKTTIAYEVP